MKVHPPPEQINSKKNRDDDEKGAEEIVAFKPFSEGQKENDSHPTK